MRSRPCYFAFSFSAQANSFDIGCSANSALTVSMRATVTC